MSGTTVDRSSLGAKLRVGGQVSSALKFDVPDTDGDFPGASTLPTSGNNVSAFETLGAKVSLGGAEPPWLDRKG